MISEPVRNTRRAVLILTLLFWIAMPVLGLTGPAMAAEAGPAVMELTLTEAIHLALRQNRQIESAYLSRILQKFNLGQERTRFRPSLELAPRLETGISGSHQQNDTRMRTQAETAGVGLQTTVTQKIPTGADITFIWDNRFETRTTHDAGETQSGLTGYSITLRQPLLKSGGLEYNTAPLIRAALQEEMNIRSLRDTVIGMISSVIREYRTLLEVDMDVQVQREALEKAREQLVVTQLMIDTGRRAANEILQAETNLARQELAYEESLARRDDAQLVLQQRLELRGDTTIVPVETVTYMPITPVFEECLALALERHSGYLGARTRLELARMTLADAANQRLWELDAEGRYRDGWHHQSPASGYRRDEWQLGLVLRVPLPIFGASRYNREQPLLSARINLRQAEMTLITEQENLETTVRNTVREVRSGLNRVELAIRARELSEQNFQFSELQFKMGRMANTLFITEQEKLRNDRLAETRSIIAYQNILTRLDQLLSTTLDTWEIEFVTSRPELEAEYLGSKVWMLDRSD